MKIFAITITTLSLSLPLHADILSTCQNSCFSAKASCNAQKSHTFNSCDHDLFACKASCSTGNSQESYGVSPLEIKFNPILDFDR